MDSFRFSVGSSKPVPVSRGYFTTGGVLEPASTVSAVSSRLAWASRPLALSPSTTRAAQSPCLRGSYCVGGVAKPCPAGSYGQIERLSTPTCSGLCAPGESVYSALLALVLKLISVMRRHIMLSY